MLYKIYDIFQKYVNTFTRYLNWCDYFKVLATHVASGSPYSESNNGQQN